MTFKEWRKEAEQTLMAWFGDDPAGVDKDHWRHCCDCSYRPWEAARYAAELLCQRATAPVAKRYLGPNWPTLEQQPLDTRPGPTERGILLKYD
jgi:hypothetical protein